MGFLSHDYDPFTHVVNYRGSLVRKARSKAARDVMPAVGSRRATPDPSVSTRNRPRTWITPRVATRRVRVAVRGAMAQPLR